jgi:zinc transporter, ZIP family
MYVFAAALATAVATGIGALPFALARNDYNRWLGPANAVASGVMLGASASLIIEGIERNGTRTAIGIVGGGLFVLVAYKAIGEGEARHIGALRGAGARKALLIVGVMTAHSAAEGIGVGAAFADTRAFGIFIAAAIALQNVPEGLAISLVLVPRGVRVRVAAAWSIFSSLPQPLLAVPAFFFVEQFSAVLPIGLGFAAGAMVLMVARELMPEALACGPRRIVVADALVAFAVMLTLQLQLAR